MRDAGQHGLARGTQVNGWPGRAGRTGQGHGVPPVRQPGGHLRALLDDAEHDFQEQVISGPPPLGPGAPPLDRLVAYGQARVAFLIDHADIARATLDGGQAIPAGSSTPLSQLHIRVLLGQLDLGPADLDMLAVQLTAALDGPLLLYLSAADLAVAPDRVRTRITRGWQDLIRRVARP